MAAPYILDDLYKEACEHTKVEPTKEITETESTLWGLNDILRMLAYDQELFKALVKLSRDDILSIQRKAIIENTIKNIDRYY
jgi:hypothetical protein